LCSKLMVPETLPFYTRQNSRIPSLCSVPRPVAETKSSAMTIHSLLRTTGTGDRIPDRTGDRVPRRRLRTKDCLDRRTRVVGKIPSSTSSWNGLFAQDLRYRQDVFMSNIEVTLSNHEHSGEHVKFRDKVMTSGRRGKTQS
jgi:hypothetical protein